MEKATTRWYPMQQCANCQYFVPAGYLSCPQCSMPLTAGVSAPNTVYTGKAGGRARKNPQAIVVGLGIALVAIVAVTLVTRGGDEPKLVESDSLAAPVNDGWRNFTPSDSSFTVSFPGVPVHSENASELNQVAQIYSMIQGDFEFGVVVSPAPAYTPPHEAGRRLAEWMRPIYEGQGGVIEAEAPLLTPRGDQAYDLVVVNGGTRNWLRFTTWKGSIIRIYATLPADKEPTPAQSLIYSRLRDSVRQ